jgi:hypothetical protein
VIIDALEEAASSLLKRKSASRRESQLFNGMKQIRITEIARNDVRKNNWSPCEHKENKPKPHIGPQ